MDVGLIKQHLAAAFQDWETEYHIYPALDGATELPAVLVQYPTEIQYNVANYAGGTISQYIITVLQPLNDVTDAQQKIDEALSYPGLVESLQRYETDAWHMLKVDRAVAVRQFAVGDRQAIAFDLLIEIIA